MAVTWKIAACDRTVALGGEADVITRVHWNVKDKETVDGVDHSGSLYGSVGIDTSDLSDFTEYDDVTEANAIAWAKEALGSDEVTRLETDVASQITLSKTPTHGTGVPW
jgi:hypothetical protein